MGQFYEPPSSVDAPEGYRLEVPHAGQLPSRPTTQQQNIFNARGGHNRSNHSVLDESAKDLRDSMELQGNRSKHKSKLQVYLNMTRNTLIHKVKDRRTRTLLTDLIKGGEGDDYLPSRFGSVD